MSHPPDAADAMLAAAPRLVIVGGKGGVGKTTAAAALAIRSAGAGVATLLVSSDPAGALADVVGLTLGATPRRVPGTAGLWAQQLAADTARAAFLGRWRSALVTIVDRGTYLDAADGAGLVDAAFPGGDETMAILALASLVGRGEDDDPIPPHPVPDDAEDRPPRFDRIILDTAPTGHTLRLLAAPATLSALVDLLDIMQEKHRFMVRTLTRRIVIDDAERLLASLRTRLAAFTSALRDPAQAAVILVTRAEPVVIAETVRYAAALRELDLHVAAVITNASPDAAAAALSAVDGVPHYAVPWLPASPIGLEGLERWAAALRAAPSIAPAAVQFASAQPPAAERPVPLRRTTAGIAVPPFSVPPFTIVGGKGGVGKTTVACALAAMLASPDEPLLLVSTDPAPSIADALDEPVGDAETTIARVPGLVARQLDATAAFGRLRERYTARIDALFDGISVGGLDAAHDRAISRQLLALAPPGIDELYALASLGETLAEARFSRVIVDPAPTGHLLRLLAMPALALDWTHQLMRLLLKHREITGLGDTAADLVAFARRTRALQARLADPAGAAVLLVALDEPVVRQETERVLQATRELGIAVSGVVWNRTVELPEPLDAEPRVAQWVAPREPEGPVGADALVGWRQAWAALEPAHV